MEFAEAHTFDNDMGYRDVCEDASKLFTLTELVQFNELMYYHKRTRIWHNRYRVPQVVGDYKHYGYVVITIKCIYTHFDELNLYP